MIEPDGVARLLAIYGTVIVPADGLGVLRPFNRREAITTQEAAKIAGITPRQMRRWVDVHGIGRKVGGILRVSRVALQMLLDDDGRALLKYREGNRGAHVWPYYSRLGLMDLLEQDIGDIGDIARVPKACSGDDGQYDSIARLDQNERGQRPQSAVGV